MSIEIGLQHLTADGSEAGPRPGMLEHLLSVARRIYAEAQTDDDTMVAEDGQSFAVVLPDGTGDVHANYAVFPLAELDSLSVRMIFEIAKTGDMAILGDGLTILIDPAQPRPSWISASDEVHPCRSPDELRGVLDAWLGGYRKFRDTALGGVEKSGGVARVVSADWTDVVQLYRFDPAGNEVPLHPHILRDLLKVAEADVLALGEDASISIKNDSLFNVKCQRGSFDVYASHALFYVNDLDAPTIRMIFDIAVAGDMSVVFVSHDECQAILPDAKQIAKAPKPWVDRGDVIVCPSPDELLVLLRRKLGLDVPPGERVRFFGEATWAPGTRPTAPASIIYVETKAGETAAGHQKKMYRYNQDLHKTGDPRRPETGLMMAEFWRLETPAGQVFYAYSYGGDKEKWRKMFRDFAAAEGRAVGEVVNFETFVQDDGRRFPVSACKCTKVKG